MGLLVGSVGGDFLGGGEGGDGGEEGTWQRVAIMLFHRKKD